MATYTFPITQARADAILERGLDGVHAYLTGQGITVAGVSLALDPPTVTVESDTDPKPFVAGIPWPATRNYAQARAAMRALMETQTPTNAQVIAALRGVIVELARD